MLNQALNAGPVDLGTEIPLVGGSSGPVGES